MKMETPKRNQIGRTILCDYNHNCKFTIMRRHNKSLQNELFRNQKTNRMKGSVHLSPLTNISRSYFLLDSFIYIKFTSTQKASSFFFFSFSLETTFISPYLPCLYGIYTLNSRFGFFFSTKLLVEDGNVDLQYNISFIIFKINENFNVNNKHCHDKHKNIKYMNMSDL